MAVSKKTLQQPALSMPVVNLHVWTDTAASHAQCIHYGLHDTRWGSCLLAALGKHVVFLGFPGAGSLPYWIDVLAREWPELPLEKADAITSGFVRDIFSGEYRDKVNVLVRGTVFQCQVWQALLDIPAGETKTYGEIARLIGKPGASRAVGSAIGKNPVSCLIPCHRVLPANGSLGNYLWGVNCKKRLLEDEGFTQRNESPAADNWR